MPKFKCWRPDLDETEADAEAFEAFDEEIAAEVYAEGEDRRSGEGFDDERDVMVRGVECGRLWKVAVFAGVSVDYTAYAEEVTGE